MKKIILVFSLIAALSLNSQVQLDTQKSNIKWTGKELTTKEHFGSLKLSKAQLDFDNDNIIFSVTFCIEAAISIWNCVILSVSGFRGL